jgi:riboflavin kinase/FMN adenylyltransferase
MLSIGTNPTVGGTVQTIEVHLFNFNDDIYDQLVTVYFIAYIRAEATFAGLPELQAQLHHDHEMALALLNQHPA